MKHKKTFSFKFGIGDKAWYLSHKFVDMDGIPCTFCNGSGRIIGCDGTKDECPRCDGVGKISPRISQSSVVEARVEVIRIDMEEECIHISYRFCDIGGNGRPESALYSTKTVAKRAAARLNKKERDRVSPLNPFDDSDYDT